MHADNATNCTIPGFSWPQIWKSTKVSPSLRECFRANLHNTVRRCVHNDGALSIYGTYERGKKTSSHTWASADWEVSLKNRRLEWQLQVEQSSSHSMVVSNKRLRRNFWLPNWNPQTTPYTNNIETHTHEHATSTNKDDKCVFQHKQQQGFNGKMILELHVIHDCIITYRPFINRYWATIFGVNRSIVGVHRGQNDLYNNVLFHTKWKTDLAMSPWQTDRMRRRPGCIGHVRYPTWKRLPSRIPKTTVCASQKYHRLTMGLPERGKRFWQNRSPQCANLVMTVEYPWCIEPVNGVPQLPVTEASMGF